MRRTTYGFRFPDFPPHIMTLHGIGWEDIQDPSYDWDGLRREDRGALFQYTLSGEGRLEANGTVYTVGKDTGFLLYFPGRNRYYFDASSEKPWEFIWIMLQGTDTAVHWDRLLGAFGPVVELKPDASPIAQWHRLYKDISEGGLRDPYELSVRVYEWLLSWEGLAEGKHRKSVVPKPYEDAKRYIDAEFRRPLTLEEIAAAAGVSKYHFCKMFQRYYGLPPTQYVTKKRIEAAALDLRRTDRPVAHVAAACGFDNGSYFGKVFRRIVGVTPMQYREGKGSLPVDELIIE
ncbi:helix-turn-helix transcriptional regulator [Paenibacillus alkalitolerans]|uniref:helix-turn-helix transcriptional regulator n=1 Tax=Paenibacillus alkalitolerans TaxID=2799335 RepID=UPI0018F430CC|nr:AraC family transcriptional regulator [Paenibacillus alkalitolerans]